VVDQRAVRGRATREQLVAAARGLFAERGFEGTSIEAVLDATGVSRGSLYHHFPGKEALFEAVVLAVEDEIGARTAEAAGDADDALAALRAGCMAWMEIARDPVVQRIVLLDAPAVLGWARWREIEEEHALGMLKGAMQVAAADGRILPELVDPYAHMLLVSVNELALLIARADDPVAEQLAAQTAIDVLLTRLLGA
jgi:AcrR family transcriptional regulator